MMISKQHEQSEDDTLSPCDLPLSLLPQDEFRSFRGNDDNDLFEFITSDSSMISHDITFCGRLFPDTGPVTEITLDSDHHPKKNRGFTRLPSLGRIRSFSKPSVTKRDGYKKLSSSSSKSSSKWQWLMFGSMRLPGKMELEEIRSRQSKQNPKTLFGLGSDDDDSDHDVMRKKVELGKGRVAVSDCEEHHHRHHHHQHHQHQHHHHRGIAVVKVISCIGSI